MKKITNNEYYNAYEHNNSGMFVCLTQYYVGEDDYATELKMGTHKKLAISTANKLNKQKKKEWVEIKAKYYECPDCNEWKLEKDYMDENDFAICENCDHFVERHQIESLEESEKEV